MEHFGLAELYDENKEIYASSTTLYDGLGKSIVDKIESLNNHEPWFYYSHIMDLHGTKKFIIKEYFKKFQNPKFGTNVYEQMLSALDVWLGKIIEKVDLKKNPCNYIC